MSRFCTAFPKLTYPDWLAKYREDILTGVEWARIKEPFVGRHWREHKTELYHPWYPKGGWKAGTAPKSVAQGENDILVEVPALSVRNRFIVLDGNHRLKELKPIVVCIDYLRPRDEDYRWFTDVWTPYWSKMVQL